MKRLFFPFILATAVVAGQPAGYADCYSIIAGKAATADGSVLFAHHEDNAPKYATGMVQVPGTNHAAGDTVKLPLGTRIPQVPTTYSYWWLMMPELSYSDALLNEFGVAIASDGCPSRENNPQITSGGIGDPVLRRAFGFEGCPVVLLARPRPQTIPPKRQRRGTGGLGTNL